MNAQLASAHAAVDCNAGVSTMPSITFLNMNGDVTITWDESNREKVMELVDRKMKQGFSFFIVRPAGTRGRAPKLKAVDDMATVGTKTLKVSNERAGATMTDEDLVSALTDGVIHVERDKPVALSGQRRPAVRATTAAEVLEAQTVAMRPVTGG